jgi:uncharacterized repeat protein (TIGR01451 family)
LLTLAYLIYGVGKGINLMNVSKNIMKKVLQNAAALTMIFTLVISAVAMPLVTTANTGEATSAFSLPGLDLPGLDIPRIDLPDFDFGNGNVTVLKCKITADSSEVFVGGSVTLSWDIPGADTVSINGQSVSGKTGSIVMTDIRANTTYTVSASAGSSSCTASVRIICLPVPVDCRLEILKTVDKTTANVGDVLTYTIKVKNIGTTDCTGSGVKIEDVLSDKLTFVSGTGSSNITAGYDGGIPVYTTANRTIHFNGNILNPNEEGTMTVKASVNAPSACGDFTIPNQAKVTAYELNNFGTWVTSNIVNTIVDNDCSNNPAPSCDSFTATPANITVGNNATLAWQTSNATRVTLNNGIGDVAVDGSKVVTPITSTIYTLTVYGTEGRSVSCPIQVTVSTDPAPSCDSFTATPATIVTGSSATLAWQTSNATRVTLNNGIGDVAVDGSRVVTPTTNTTYTLTVYGTQNRSVTCAAPVTVSTDPVPVCEYFTATPNTLPAAGGQVALNWKVTGATNVSIAPTIGTVAAVGTQNTNVTASTNFILTATDADGDQVTCAAPVTLGTNPPPTLSCQNNVTFTASSYSIDEGDNTVLTWNTTNLDSVSISGINATTLSGSTTVEPSSDTTYVLTARKGTQSVDCPISIDVDTNSGGGGGSSSPKCELTVSDNKIKSGEQVTLKWETSRATKVTLKDDKSKTLMSTDKYDRDEREDYYDGSIKVRPTRDTEYILVAEKGSKDRTCKVKVNVDDLKVITNRDQQPLVAGISLSNVPYTGFEAGPFLTVVFYTLLAAWALFLSYLIISRRQPVTDFMAFDASSLKPMDKAEAMRPDVFVPSIAASQFAVAETPVNLPTGTPVIGYENMLVSTNPHHVSDDIVTALEDRAHEQMALLSSDAIRHFIGTTEGMVERNEALDTVIATAKQQFPLEDGWIVINEARMRDLCVDCVVAPVTADQFVPTVVPEGSSSLAEAIVTGNIVAAYEMIGNRPMFALADAAADFDNVVRARKGEDVQVSNLLTSEASKLSDEKIKNIVAALTGALDGTYTDEASAVKMAIMKAVKEVA